MTSWSPALVSWRSKGVGAKELSIKIAWRKVVASPEICSPNIVQ